MKRRTQVRGHQMIERLEDRTLLSGWATVDNFQFVAGRLANPGAIVADSSGDVYAVGTGGTNTVGINLGIIREKPAGAGSFTTIAAYNYPDGRGAYFSSATMDAAGDLFVGGLSFSGHWLVLERPASPAGAPFSVIDDVAPVGLNPGSNSSGQCKGLAVDAAGDVFAIGHTGTQTHSGQQNSWLVRERAAGHTAFVTVDKLTVTGSIDGASGVSVINSGPNAGVYVAGETSSRYWIVRKSTNGGASWSTVDQFQYNPNSRDESIPFAITADAAGSLYVTGVGDKSVTSGRTLTTTGHWLVRQSANGGATWTIGDDFVAGTLAEGWAIGTDPLGNVFTAGRDNASGSTHSIVRTNAGGTWHTIDDFSGATTGLGFAADGQGNLYALSSSVVSGDEMHWITRELPALNAAIATPTQNPTDGSYSTTISFNRPVSGLDLSDLSLTTPDGTFSGADLSAAGATLTTADNVNYVLSLPASLTGPPGGYSLLLTAAGSGITDVNVLPLTTSASASWTQ